MVDTIMQAAAFSLASALYEPFGAGTSFQTYTPRVRLDSGIRYVGSDRYGMEDNDVSAFAEVLDVTHNLGQPSRGKDRITSVLRFPIVKSIDGVDTVVDTATIEITSKMPKDLAQSVKERYFWVANILSDTDLLKNAVLDNDVPI